jgi:hypothetical protein
MIGVGHIDALVGHGKEDPEFAAVKTDGRRPDATAGLHLAIARVGHVLDRVVDERPIDKVARVQDRQSRRAVEAGGDQPEIVTVPDDVRIGIVGVDDRIAVRAVAGIGYSGIGKSGRHERKCFPRTGPAAQVD